MCCKKAVEAGERPPDQVTRIKRIYHNKRSQEAKASYFSFGQILIACIQDQVAGGVCYESQTSTFRECSSQGQNYAGWKEC